MHAASCMLRVAGACCTSRVALLHVARRIVARCVSRDTRCSRVAPAVRRKAVALRRGECHQDRHPVNARLPLPVCSPGADVGGVGPVPEKMRQRWVKSRGRCGRGGPSPDADVARGGPGPGAYVEGVSTLQHAATGFTAVRRAAALPLAALSGSKRLRRTAHSGCDWSGPLRCSSQPVVQKKKDASDIIIQLQAALTLRIASTPGLAHILGQCCLGGSPPMHMPISAGDLPPELIHESRCTFSFLAVSQLSACMCLNRESCIAVYVNVNTTRMWVV